MITKKKLLSLIKENIDEMAMDFDTEDRPHQDIQSRLQSGETPLKKVPLPSTNDPNKNFQELLASQRYRQVIQNVRRYTNINVPLKGESNIMPLAQMMMSAHNSIVETEMNHKSELEKLAIQLVIKEMGIPYEGEIQFRSTNEGTEGLTSTIRYVAKIVGLNQIDLSDFNIENSKQPEMSPVDIEKDLLNDLEKLNLEKAKRRMINAIMQGASKRGHYMYHYVTNELRTITGSDDLINQYGVLMSINDTLYWQISDEKMKMMMGGGGPGGVGGKEKVDHKTDPPTVYAEAINFPVLIHELLKGTYELIAIHGRPKDESGQEADFSDIESSEDTLNKEIWDLRLGPAIWDRMRAQIPEEILTDETKKDIQYILFMHIVKKDAKQFLVFMKEVLSGSDNGKRLMKYLIDSIESSIRDYEYQETMEKFDEDLEDISDNTDNDDLEDFLGDFGIRLSDN